MLKVNEQISRENLDKVSKLVKQAFGDRHYHHLYAYQEKNFILFKSLTHYAIGFTEDAVVAIPMSAAGESLDDPKTFKIGSETKVSMSGMVSLSNGVDKIKVQVPGALPKLMGMKQLEVTQLEAQSLLIQRLKR